MKRLRTILTLGFLTALAVLLARAGSTILLGSMVTVNNTITNSAGIVIGNFSVPAGRFLIQNGGLSNTNALTVNVQLSLDDVNFTTVASYQPSVTNAVTDVFNPSFSPQNIYMRLQTVTTNSVQVGETFVQ